MSVMQRDSWLLLIILPIFFLIERGSVFVLLLPVRVITFGVKLSRQSEKVPLGVGKYVTVSRFADSDGVVDG